MSDVVHHLSIFFRFVLLFGDRCSAHVRLNDSYMYEEINSFFVRLDLTIELINKSIIIINIDVLYTSKTFRTFLIVVDIYRMADADNRVILNVGGIRHETCM